MGNKADKCVISLEKEGSRRATPWRMLEHPWMQEMQGRRVDMAQFLRKVWMWDDDKPSSPALA